MNTPENTTTNIGGKAVSPESEGPDAEGTTLLEQAPSGETGDRAAKLQAEVERHRDEALRTRADFENTRKRLQREKEEGISYANLRLLERLLPVLDNFELGMAEARKSAEDSAVLNGMSMVQKQLEDFLRENGVQPIDAVGQKFDPNLHEALGEVPDDQTPEGHVVRQLRKGYKLKERLLRAANVFVSKGKS
jgi:molecular chaperone GrpE